MRIRSEGNPTPSSTHETQEETTSKCRVTLVRHQIRPVSWCHCRTRREEGGIYTHAAQTAVGGVAASGKADFVSTIQSHKYNHFCEYQKKT